MYKLSRNVEPFQQDFQRQQKPLYLASKNHPPRLPVGILFSNSSSILNRLPIRAVMPLLLMTTRRQASMFVSPIQLRRFPGNEFTQIALE